ncbi:uncharacterized protein DS421_1g14600 [Arachis hypogaea]|nr:uncharacterized protein DS421_1g14600 [Arachis hypogaea]
MVVMNEGLNSPSKDNGSPKHGTVAASSRCYSLRFGILDKKKRKKEEKKGRGKEGKEEEERETRERGRAPGEEELLAPPPSCHLRRCHRGGETVAPPSRVELSSLTSPAAAQLRHRHEVLAVVFSFANRCHHWNRGRERERARGGEKGRRRRSAQSYRRRRVLYHRCCWELPPRKRLYHRFIPASFLSPVAIEPPEFLAVVEAAAESVRDCGCSVLLLSNQKLILHIAIEAVLLLRKQAELKFWLLLISG